MIIFGTRNRYKTIDTGSFYCPHCGKERQYDHKQVKNYFALYFIPVFPIGDGDEFIECQTCHRSYALDALKFKPSRPQNDVARVINTVKFKLEQGFPVEYVISDLTIDGFDREVAHNMVNMAVGEGRKTCPKCELTYADAVEKCPDCQITLVARDE